MLQHVTNVLIGKKVATATGKVAEAQDIEVGDIVMVNEIGEIIADASTAKTIKFGVCKGHIANPKDATKKVAIIDYANEIQKASKPHFTYAEFKEPTQQKITIDLSAETEAVPGHRYVIRIVYKDFEVANYQFTHTYEVYPETKEIADLIAEMVKQINSHKNRRVQAEASGNSIVLTALEVDDNEGVDSLNTYRTVNMEASMYKVVPGALIGNNDPHKFGEITKEVGTPGRGFWKQVRDAEVKNMGYKGQVFTGAYPSVEQKRMVTEGTGYNCLTVEHENLYLSNDNQYIKNTPLTTELYCEKDGDISSLVAALTAFNAADLSAE